MFDDLDFDLDFSTCTPQAPALQASEKKAVTIGDTGNIVNSAKLIKYQKIHFAKINSIEEILNYPKKNEQIRVITQNSFNSYTLLSWIQKQERIKDLVLTTYNMKEAVISAIFEMLTSKKIDSLTIILSDSIRHRTPKRIEQIEDLFHAHKKDFDVRVKLTWNHTKILLAKTDKNFYCVEGSGNLTDNARLEQYCIDNNKAVYDFHLSWIDEAFKKDILKREETLK